MSDPKMTVLKMTMEIETPVGIVKMEYDNTTGIHAAKEVADLLGTDTVTEANFWRLGHLLNHTMWQLQTSPNFLADTEKVLHECHAARIQHIKENK